MKREDYLRYCMEFLEKLDTKKLKQAYAFIQFLFLKQK